MDKQKLWDAAVAHNGLDVMGWDKAPMIAIENPDELESLMAAIQSADARQVVADERAYTAEEARKIFLDQVRHLVSYWERESREPTAKGKLEGLAFSIMNIFDGTSGLPAFDIVCAPHPEDKQYHIDEGSKYFVPGMAINECYLHEMLFSGRADAPVQAQEPWINKLSYDAQVDEWAIEKSNLEREIEDLKSRAPVQPVPDIADDILSVLNSAYVALEHLGIGKTTREFAMAEIVRIRAVIGSAATAAQGDAKDAERYRYIRDTETIEAMVWEALDGDGSVNGEGELDRAGYAAGMDRAIDAAIVAKAAS